MNTDQRLKLSELIKEGDVQDNTSNIQRLKHSKKIRADVNKIKVILAKTESLDYTFLDHTCSPHCTFIIENYKNIYQRILKGKIDFTILNDFLDCLQSVEDGLRDQHEASYEIGMLLKSLYIDPKIYEEPERRNGVNISWNEYKNKIVN